MLCAETLRKELIQDMERLNELILRCAAGERNVRQARDRLDEVVEMKMDILRSLEAR